MANITSTIKVGDSARLLTDTLSLNGAPIDLTGATVRLIWSVKGGAVDRKTATIVTPASGTVSYQLLAGDVAAEATVLLEWEITFPGGTILTVPTTDKLILCILPDLG